MKKPAHIEEMQYIAQYTVKTNDATRFVKDVYFIQVSSLANRTDYLETDGPCLFTSIKDIPYSERSFCYKMTPFYTVLKG